MDKKLKVLLINPPITTIVDPSLPEILLSDEDPMPPLGIMYIAAYLEKQNKYQVNIIDCQADKIDIKKLEEKFKTEKPDIIGVTTMTFTLMDVLEVVKAAKKSNPDTVTVLGGPHVHIFPNETINLPNIDYLVLGEGEQTFSELLDMIANNLDPYNVKGIVFKDQDGVVNTGFRQLNENLDDVPFPARHLLSYKKYTSSMAKNQPVTTMFTSRGCPFKCLFCDRPHLGEKFRARSAKNVVAEMIHCAQMGIKEIFIYDDTFGVDRQRVLDICRLIGEAGLKIDWDIRTRVNTVDEEVIKVLKTAGCQRIHFGVEAGTEHILKVLRKGITLEMAKKAFALARKYKIQTLGYFMIGSPEESREEILETIRLAKKLNPDFAHFTITTPFPATDLYNLGLSNKVLSHDYWREFAENPTREFEPMVWEEELNKEELTKLLKKAYRSFYMRPSYLLKRTMAVRSLSEFMTKAKMGFKILKI